MTNILTIEQQMWSGSNDSAYITASGSLKDEKSYLNDTELRQNTETNVMYILQQKIDELVKEVNTLKNQ